jgi:hypothetical protein
MTYKIALYEGPDKNWYWYILPVHTAFNSLLLADGHEKNIRRAIRAARDKAKNRGQQISYTYMERY